MPSPNVDSVIVMLFCSVHELVTDDLEISNRRGQL